MSIKERFNELEIIWDNETGYLSNMDKKFEHPAYKEILSMGWLLVPTLLELMDRPSTHMCFALGTITKQWPSKPEDAGRIRVFCDDWRQWGKEHSTLVAILSGLEGLIVMRQPLAFVEFHPPSENYEHGLFTIDTYLGRDQELYIEGDEYGYLDACVSETVEQHDHVEGVTVVEDFLSALKDISKS